MKRRSNGNILISYSDDKTTRSLEMYFYRKHFKVFVSHDKKDIENIAKHSALDFVFIGDETVTEERLSIAKAITDKDIFSLIAFVSEKEFVIQEDISFKDRVIILNQPLNMRTFFPYLNKVRKNFIDNKFKNNEVRFSKFRLLYNQKKLIFDGNEGKKEFDLTKKECFLLYVLATHSNILVSRHRLLKECWGKDDYASARSMDVYITKMRKYLSEDGNIRLTTVHSTGYCLKV